MNTVPMYEAKNKLPLFMHQAEESGPVFISRRNKTVGVILSFDDYNKLLSKQPKRTILEAAEEFRKKTAGMFTNEDIDKIFDVRDHTPDSYEIIRPTLMRVMFLTECLTTNELRRRSSLSFRLKYSFGNYKTRARF